MLHAPHGSILIQSASKGRTTTHCLAGALGWCADSASKPHLWCHGIRVWRTKPRPLAPPVQAKSCRSSMGLQGSTCQSRCWDGEYPGYPLIADSDITLAWYFGGLPLLIVIAWWWSRRPPPIIHHQSLKEIKP